MKKQPEYRGMTEVREFTDYIEKLDDRLNRRMRRGKMKSKLTKKGKSNIPGFGYWFQTK
jgi:hypothetical protein